MMLSEELVSIVVPVYNVEEYLEKCLQTLVTQTYQNVEILLIDDGSTDLSGRICDKYALDYDNITVFHCENSGLSASRNYGVTKSVGKYIVFIDSDDYVSDDYVEYLLGLLMKYNSDIAVTKLQSGFESDYKFVSDVDVEYVANSEQALIEMMYGYSFGFSACGKIFPKEILLKHKFPNGKLFEDIATTYKIIGDAKSVSVSNKRIYYYRQREGSITHQKLDEEHLYGLYAAEEELEYMKQFFPKAIPAAEYRCCYKVLQYIPRVLGKTEDDKMIFMILRDCLKNHIKPIYRDKNVRMYNKVKCIFVILGYYPTYILWTLIENINTLKKRG